MNLKETTSFGLFLALAVGWGTFTRADTIRLLSGDELRGEIRKESIKEVTLVLSTGGTRTCPRREIAPDGITHETLPADLRDAREALEARDFDRAHRGFREVIERCEDALGLAEKANGKNEKAEKVGKKKGSPKPAPGMMVRTVFYQHALYGEAQTFAEEGKDDAVKAINTLLDRVPDTCYLLDALLLRVRLVGAKGNASDITAAVEDSKRRAAAAGAGAEVADRIRLIRAEQLLREKKSGEAQRIYQDLQRSPVREVEEAAKLGLARMLVLTGATGEIAEARITFNGLLRDSANRAVLCGAASGLGDIQLKEMGGEKTREGLGSALESYLRSVLLYFPGDGDPTEAHQAALLSAAECALELAALAKKDPRPLEAYRMMARDLYQEVQRTYPRTEAARKALEGLKKLSAGGSR